MQKFSRPFLTISILDNRIEVLAGMWPFRKRTAIPYRNVASVEVSKFTRQLIVTTNDDKTHKYAIGGFGKAQACRDAIADKL